MLVEWNEVDSANLAIFLESETGRKLREMSLELMPKKAGKTIEESALASERMFGFLSFWSWSERLIATQPAQAKNVSPWFVEDVPQAGKSRNPS